MNEFKLNEAFRNSGSAKDRVERQHAMPVVMRLGNKHRRVILKRSFLDSGFRNGTDIFFDMPGGPTSRGRIAFFRSGSFLRS